MRHQVLVATLATLAAAPAFAGETAVELGANAGVFVFDSLDQVHTSWLATPRAGVWFNQMVGLEVDVGIAGGRTDVPGHSYFAIAPSLNFVADPLMKDRKKAPIRPLLSIGAGFLDKKIDDKGELCAAYAHTRMEGFGSFGTGLIVPIVGPLSFRTDARILISGGPRTDMYKDPLVDFMWTGGLDLRIAVVKDSDKDKLSDKVDQCPTDAEDVDQFEDTDGCPDPDNDADGIPDATDQCPNEGEDLDGFEDGNGCPDPDNDGDGVLDADDACALQSGPAATQGCPDADGDGLADKDDECPGKTGPIEAKGCPDTDGDGLRDPDDECPEDAGSPAAFGCPDADADRVPDYRDDCPEKPVPTTVDPMRSNGCPARVYVTLDAIQINEQVYFDTGTAKIKPQSYGLLNDIAVVLRQYPSIKKVRVEGHTDSQGDDAANLTLSQARAQAVVDYLKDVGVAAERMVATGFGETRPVADNKTAAGRATNRRVAITILEQEAQKVEVEQGADQGGSILDQIGR
jgi:outer membrane protein OmpA-like peptidoglycan-associated protein